tara:strand:+ start:101 stop:532 length:432 start_codon:yes stop_codon:yes gene_type:complete
MKHKIILPKGHSTNQTQTIEVDGELFLKNGFGREIPAVFELGEARRKARLFDGNTVESPSKYDIADEYKVAQINGDNIPMSVITALETCCSFIDNDKTIGEKLYSVGSIGEDLIPNAEGELKKELLELYDYVHEYMYVTFIKC